MNRVEAAIARLEAEGALPKRERTSLEDECTHILSERLNDQAPLYEEAYRPHARRLIGVIAAVERTRIRRELLQAIDAATLRPEREGVPVSEMSPLEREIRAALDRICPADADGKEG